jgi:hypothetical protein
MNAIKSISSAAMKPRIGGRPRNNVQLCGFKKGDGEAKEDKQLPHEMKPKVEVPVGRLLSKTRGRWRLG